MRFWRVACVVLAALTLMPARGARADDNPQQGAQGIALTRMNALQSGDKQAWMSTVDPDATQAFKEAQGDFFDGLRSLPLSKFELTVTTTDSGDLAAGLNLKSKYKAQQAYLPETNVNYRLGTYDDRDAVDTYFYTYVERGGHWYIAASNDAAVLGLDSKVELWDNGPVSTFQAPHFLVISLPDKAARAQQVAGIAEQAMNTFDSRWTLPWSSKIPLIDPDTTNQANAMVGQDISGLVALVTYAPLRDAGWDITAPRLIVNDTQLENAPANQQQSTLVHELTHAASVPLAGPLTPRWVHEGLAEWVRLGMPNNANPGTANPVLPADSDFASPATINQAYTAATSAMSFVDSLVGPSGPAKLFEAIGERRLNVGSPSFNMDQAMQEVTGLTLQQFEAKWDAKYPTATLSNTGPVAAD